MAGHVPVRDLLEDGEVPEVLGYACEVQRDEEVVSVLKEHFLGEVLDETSCSKSRRVGETDLVPHGGTEIDAFDMWKWENIAFMMRHHQTEQIL